MPKDPAYVRLGEHLPNATQADIAGGSGWSISGNAVRPFPKDDEAAARFVRQRLSVGVLEPASKAEYDEQQQSDEEVAELISAASTHQENRIEMVTAEATRKRKARRAKPDEGGGDGGNGGE